MHSRECKLITKLSRYFSGNPLQYCCFSFQVCAFEKTIIFYNGLKLFDISLKNLIRGGIYHIIDKFINSGVFNTCKIISNTHIVNKRAFLTIIQFK